jgi:cyclic dehypoxanthinyl futalosine synthase
VLPTAFTTSTSSGSGRTAALRTSPPTGAADTRRYKAFIAWPFQRENTPLGRGPDWGRAPEQDPDEPFPGDVVARLDGSGDKQDHPAFGRSVRMAGSTDYLRTQALGRLYLDNVYSIGSSWVTMGPHVGQTALHFCANDMGSVMMEENVVSAAGTTYCLNEAVICRLIREAGFLPAQRDNEYNLLNTHVATEAPDQAVEDWATLRAQRLVTETGEEGRTGRHVAHSVRFRLGNRVTVPSLLWPLR